MSRRSSADVHDTGSGFSSSTVVDEVSADLPVLCGDHDVYDSGVPSVVLLMLEATVYRLLIRPSCNVFVHSVQRQIQIPKTVTYPKT